jgi:hypothetical protein
MTVLEDGLVVQAGLVHVLRERGIDVAGKNVDELRTIMAAQPDFTNEPNILESIIRARGHLCLFYPKFHCELSPIEAFWAAVKRFTRRYCGYKKKNLSVIIPFALQSVCTQTLKRIFGKCRRVEQAYRDKMTSTDMLIHMKVNTHRAYQSHRQADPQIRSHVKHTVASSCYCGDCSDGSTSVPDLCMQGYCVEHGRMRADFEKSFTSVNVAPVVEEKKGPLGKVLRVLQVKQKTKTTIEVQVEVEGAEGSSWHARSKLSTKFNKKMLEDYLALNPLAAYVAPVTSKPAPMMDPQYANSALSAPAVASALPAPGNDLLPDVAAFSPVPASVAAVVVANSLPDSDVPAGYDYIGCDVCRRWRVVPTIDIETNKVYSPHTHKHTLTHKHTQTHAQWADGGLNFRCSQVCDDGCQAACCACGDDCECCPKPNPGNISLQLINGWKVDNQKPIPNRQYRLFEVAARELLFTAKPVMTHAERIKFWNTVSLFVLC